VLVVVHRDFQSPGSKFSRRCLYFVALVYGISDISVSWRHVFANSQIFYESSWTPAIVCAYNTFIQSFQWNRSVFCGVCLCIALLQICSSLNPIIIQLIHTLHVEYLLFLLGSILMCNLYVFDRVLWMSSFKYILVSIDIHVMCAVRHSIERVILWDISVHVVVNAHIVVMCVIRRLLGRGTLHHTNIYIVVIAHIAVMFAVRRSIKRVTS